MNCCDYNCNQGRDCPARKAPACDLPPPTYRPSNWRRPAIWVILGTFWLAYVVYVVRWAYA